MSTRYKRLPDVGSPAEEGGGAVLLAAQAPRGDWTSVIPVGLAMSAPWWEGIIRNGVPAPRGLWKTRLIPAGIWLFRGQPSVEDAALVARIPADPERLALVVGGMEPDATTFDAMARVLAVLPEDCPRAVRVFLPSLNSRAGSDFARENRLDLVAAPAQLRIRGGPTCVTAPGGAPPDGFWQWYRTRSGELAQPCGAVYPQPRWEAALSRHSVRIGQSGAVVARIPAGFSIRPLGRPDLGFMRFAAGLAPSTDRLRVAVQASGVDPLLMLACIELLDSLPPAATRQVELVWPYAGSGEGAGQLRELAVLLEAPVVAPAAGLGTHPNGGELVTVHEDGTLGDWVRCTADGRVLPQGPLAQPPRWERLLAGLLGGSRSAGPVLPVPAGLHVLGAEGSAVAVLADRLAPERDGVTLLADGDAEDGADRERVLAVLDRFSRPLLTGLRVVMDSAAEGGAHSFGQSLANRLDVRVLVATSESIQAAVRGADGRPQTGLLTWKRFLPGSDVFTGGHAAT